jgi:hypothetical protein
MVTSNADDASKRYLHISSSIRQHVMVTHRTKQLKTLGEKIESGERGGSEEECPPIPALSTDIEP